MGVLQKELSTIKFAPKWKRLGIPDVDDDSCFAKLLSVVIYNLMLNSLQIHLCLYYCIMAFIINGFNFNETDMDFKDTK
jgi:hypothetical protein